MYALDLTEPESNGCLNSNSSSSVQPDDLLTTFSRWCDPLAAGQQLPVSVMAISLIPAILGLCVFQVPQARSQLRRIPHAVLCMLLLLACSVSFSQRSGTTESTSQTQSITELAFMMESSSSSNMLTKDQASAAAGLDVKQQQQQGVKSAEILGALSDGSLDDVMQAAEAANISSRDAQRSCFLVAVLPLVLGLMMRQAPVIAIRARWRSVPSVVLSVLCAVLLVGLVEEVGAEPSRCPAVKTVCPPRPSLPAPRPPTTAAAAVTRSPAPSTTTTTTSQSRPTAPPSPRSYTDMLLAAMRARKEALHVASTVNGGISNDGVTHDGSDDDVMPQRVVPVGLTPRLSKAVENQMYSKLLAVLMDRNSHVAAGANRTSSTASGRQQSPAPAVNTTRVPPGSQKDSNNNKIGDNLLYLENARLRVGMDPRRGGSLTFLSSDLMPAEWAGVNLINTWDSGRLIQQSYYGCVDGSCWSDKPWRWNPVQGGSWHNEPPRLLFSSNVGGVMSTSAVPRNWGSQGLVDDVVMLNEARLMGSVVKVRFTMRYTGSVSHPPRHQEVPAVFVDRRLNVLATYTGNAPWTNGQLTFLMPGQTNEYYKPTEKWAAYVDSKSGFGVGIYTPIADQLVAYRVGPENSRAPHDCSYLSPLVTKAITPNSEFSYDSYIAVGRVDQMRQWFADIAATVQLSSQGLRSISPPRTYAAVEQPLATPRYLVQANTTSLKSTNSSNRSAAVLPGSTAQGPNTVAASIPSASKSVRSNQTSGNPARDDLFTQVLQTRRTVVVRKDDINSRLSRAAHQVLLPFRKFPGLDVLPTMLPPMPITVTTG